MTTNNTIDNESREQKVKIEEIGWVIDSDDRPLLVKVIMEFWRMKMKLYL